MKKMKKIANLGLLIVIGIVVGNANAQSSGHSVTLRWTASRSGNTTVNIYRETGACPPSATSTNGFTRIASNYVSGGPFVDSSVVAGNTYCYVVTAVAGGAESLPSNPFQAVVPHPYTVLEWSAAVIALLLVLGLVALRRAKRSAPKAP
jgi:hypothetical protein